jgi:hypothetical protein
MDLGEGGSSTYIEGVGLAQVRVLGVEGLDTLGARDKLQIDGAQPRVDHCK